jgi:hypothetical protein
MNNTNREENYYLGYYSHSKRMYNTSDENAEYDYLESVFNGYIICPNKDLGTLKSENHSLETVKRMDFLFVSEFNGAIGRGSFKECALALEKKIPLFVIKKNGTIMWIEKVTEVIQINEYNLFEHGVLKSKVVRQEELPFRL